MDRFPDRGHVRLRNRELGKYLHADPDGHGVSLRWNRASMNVAWAVQIFKDAWGTAYVLLQGAAYGLYLGCNRGRLLEGRGHRGVRLVQSLHDVPELEGITWQVSVSESGDDVLLRNVHGAGYLRGNGYFRGWNDRPTVDDGHRSIMMLWVVEPIPARQNIPGLPVPQIQEPHPIGYYIRMAPNVIQPPWRLIRFVLVGAHGWYNDDSWAEVQFRGNSILHLRNWMVIEVTRLTTGLPAGVTEEELYAQLYPTLELDFVMCVRAGVYARLCPMLVDLPGDGRTISIVVIMTGTPAEARLRYPDIHAE